MSRIYDVAVIGAGVKMCIRDSPMEIRQKLKKQIFIYLRK